MLRELFDCPASWLSNGGNHAPLTCLKDARSDFENSATENSSKVVNCHFMSVYWMTRTKDVHSIMNCLLLIMCHSEKASDKLKCMMRLLFLRKKKVDFQCECATLDTIRLIFHVNIFFQKQMLTPNTHASTIFCLAIRNLIK